MSFQAYLDAIEERTEQESDGTAGRIVVRSAARDSRHQLGDAIDLAVDANRDGRVNSKDAKLLTMAVDIVERTHPDLAGGMGIYSRSRPFVHIDARGTKVRWRG